MRKAKEKTERQFKGGLRKLKTNHLEGGRGGLGKNLAKTV